MKDLVFLEPNKIDAIPFTTSDVIAEYAEVSYRSVQRMIEKHIDRLKKFGIMRFEITLSGKAGLTRLNKRPSTAIWPGSAAGRLTSAFSRYWSDYI